MAVRLGLWSRTSTFGRAPSGWRACASSRRTSAASGNRRATTTTAIRGKKNVTAAGRRPDETTARLADLHGQGHPPRDRHGQNFHTLAPELDGAPRRAAL